MIGNNNAVAAKNPGSETARRRARTAGRRTMVLGLALLLGTNAWADAPSASIDGAATTRGETTLTGVQATARSTGQVDLDFAFSGPTPTAPRLFTTESPARIVVDFPDTGTTAPRRQDVGQGPVVGVSLVAAGGRTRAVVDLMRTAVYQTHARGTHWILTVGGASAGSLADAISSTDPTKALPSASQGPVVQRLDFRRGAHGEGKILMSLSSDVRPQISRQGHDVLVALPGAHWSKDQPKRLDTLDFATPVTFLAAEGADGHAILRVGVKDRVQTTIEQDGDQTVVVVAPVAKGLANGDRANGSSGTANKSAEQPLYAGTKTTFNFQDVPVRSALQLIADISGTNLVAADSVGGSVTLHLVNVPWDQALDVILRAKGLDKRKNGNVIWIAPQTEMAQYEHNLAAARSAARDSEDLVSEYVPISYGKAADIAKLLTSGSMGSKGAASADASPGSTANGFLSPRGSVSFDQRTNTLLLNDTPEQVAKIRKLIAVLDKPVQQVLIESRIVVATDDFTRDLGVKFGLQGKRTNPSGQVVSVGGQDNGNGTTSGLNVNMPVTTPSGSFGFAILGANYAIDLELSAAQTEGRSEVISSPRVITANQQEAVIRQGQEIGYVTYQNSGGQGAGSGTATVQFKDAVLELKVTPTITADNRVYLAINVKKDALAGYVDAPGSGKIPTIDTREINTSVLVDNGQTVVLGGIYEGSKNNSASKVPGLGDIPGIGALFRSTTRSNTKAELLIFVTPRILSDSLK